MAKVRTLPATGNLFIDFRYQGRRCREYTALADTPANRKKLEKLAERIDAEIALGTFDYAKFFPGSRMIARLALPVAGAAAVPATSSATPFLAAPSVTVPGVVGNGATAAVTPSFAEFVDTWVAENAVRWRRSHKRTIDDMIRGRIVPAFGAFPVAQITKSQVLAFRTELAKLPGRRAETLSGKRINAVMNVLRQILNEAADRYEFVSPYRNIKALKVLKSDVEPFSLDEVRLIIDRVRPDFRNYYIVRFLTGMRTGEIDGLKWRYVDFERRLILVRETIVAGEPDTTKTEGSQREIQMSEIVLQALKAQQEATAKLGEYVFCNREGQPLDHNNVTTRVWYPLLRHLDLRKRRPYQTRHTAATLWLGSGENPQWIARQLGHASTEMLFKVYARFVPNLTRQDGSAFERLLVTRFNSDEEDQK